MNCWTDKKLEENQLSGCSANWFNDQRLVNTGFNETGCTVTVVDIRSDGAMSNLSIVLLSMICLYKNSLLPHSAPLTFLSAVFGHLLEKFATF